MIPRALENGGGRRGAAGGSRSGGGERSVLDGLGRLVRYRIIIPLKRSRHPPEHTARGVMVGLVWGFTPTVGIQMPLVFVTWLVARRLFKWDFSVIIGMAWTWITNVVTMGPMYYAFYLTGQVLLGRGGEATGYSAFRELWDGAFSSEAGADDDDVFAVAKCAADEDPIGLLVEDLELSAFQNAFVPYQANGDIDCPETARAFGERRQGKPKAWLVQSPGDFQASQVAVTNAVEGCVKGEQHVDAARAPVAHRQDRADRRGDAPAPDEQGVLLAGRDPVDGVPGHADPDLGVGSLEQIKHGCASGDAPTTTARGGDGRRARSLG